jgi:CRISPR/Cas system-associated exonuclease Cas4 (RecB family)
MIGFANSTDNAATLKPKGIAGRDFISWSQLSTFRRCPLSYQFRYLDKVEPEYVASSLIIGSSIHAAIEMWHRKELEGADPPDLDGLLTRFWEEWKDRTEDSADIRFSKRESDLNAVHQLASRMLLSFLESPHRRVAGNLIGIEERLTENILEGRQPLLGVVDLVFDSDDHVVVRDYKTAGRRWNQGNAEANAGQLELYGELIKRRLPNREVRFEFIVLTKSKSPTVERFTVESNRRRIERTKLIANYTLDAIATGVFYPNKSPMTCSTCPYQSACSAWKG